ncbi:ATP-binding protein [Bradyrhizobium arachidis]|uniref:AAA family ATPase n=1 Tax=Bradyrhizobium arachidis TaxID=858423 RepID=UPI0021628533|nr:ATP-binding protein [Bradyrhizobium arachidis]UVO30164.1 ATP-binding protein [Bradyrhizobium arachidis]
MKLVSVEVDHFKNILKSGDVAIQPDVTCVVGKNESGKTAFLQALHRFNPAQPNVMFNAQRQYPAWLEKQHRRRKNLDEHCPVACTFELEKPDLELVEEALGRGALKNKTISISRTYGNEFRWNVEINEPTIVAHIASGLLTGGPTPTSIDDLNKLIETLGNSTHADEAKTAADRTLARDLTEARTKALGERASIDERPWDLLLPRLPQFFYFDDYSQLPASVKIRQLLAKNKKDLNSGELTARALLELGGADNEYLLNPDYETRKRELENIANAITHQVLTFWSTNPELRTEVDMTLKQEQAANGQQQVLDELKIRLYDNRHLLSLSFDERSTGFRWFFSFLAAFSEYENNDTPVVILLDEPGLGLHARAQADFLRFIDERLSKRCPVIYTTHSPFMVQPGKLERVRLVQDGGRQVGSQITSNVLSTDRDTLFPLQGALGYDMVQHLFIAPHNLIVEGTSDFTYLNLLSTHLASMGRTGLDPKWSIIPVGGADLIPSFVALLGNHLELTVLIDSRKEGNQRLQHLTQLGLLKGTRLITIGEIIGAKVGDVEDLFAPEEYLRLFNEAFAKSFKVSDLVGKDSIVNRLARLIKVDRYDHGLPATALLKNYPSILPTLAPETLTRFESLFQRINSTLGT